MKTKNLSHKSQVRMDASGNGNHLDLFLIGYVGDWGNSIEDFLYRIRQMPNLKTIDVYISSLGGCFEDGLPIFNVLKMHAAFVTTKVIGYACSMASVIMLAGDKVQASQNAIIMIHRAQGLTWGDADKFREYAAILEVHEKSVIPEYMRRMNKSEAEVLALLKAETWYNAQPALDVGLIDEIIDTVAINNDGSAPPFPEQDNEDDAITENSAKYALEHYKNIPTDLRSNLEKITGSKQEQSLFKKFLNFIGKEQSKMLTDDSQNPSLPDEIDMTEEQLKAQMTENNKVLLACVAEMLKKPEPEPQAEGNKDTEIAELKTKVVAMETKLAGFEELTAKVIALSDIIAEAGLSTDAIDFDASAGAVENEEKY